MVKCGKAWSAAVNCCVMLYAVVKCVSCYGLMWCGTCVVWYSAGGYGEVKYGLFGVV